MNVTHSIAELTAEISRLRNATPQRPIALVPTMGALHDGHCALIRRAREIVGNKGIVGVSIFVNPIQFDRAEDFQNYPSTLETDLAAAKLAGADLIFAPNPADMYFPDRSITVTESSLAAHLCGSTRPGHFDGVCTVVLKLFNLFRADFAVFGKKDYQQLAVIRRMVRDLNLPIIIEGAETVRESDGLAMSSRNLHLTPEDRKRAAAIRVALLSGKNAVFAGNTDVSSVIKIGRKILHESNCEKIDYFTLVDAETLQPVPDNIKRDSILACAVFYGKVRLIDNIELF